MVQEPKRKFTRQELYNLVWGKPVSRIAKDYGISDVALRKICKQHDIPLASNKWWAAQIHGGHVEQTPLSDNGTNATITMPFREIDEQAVNRNRELKAKASSAANVAVQEGRTQTPLNPVAKAMIAELRAVKPTDRGYIFLESESSFKFGIPKFVLPRVEALLAGLIPAILAMGYEIETTKDGARILAEGYSIPLYIRDISKRIMVKSRWGDGLEASFEPSDRLTVLVNDLGGGRELYPQKAITDTPRVKVENKIDAIVLALSYVPIANRERDARHRQWEAEWAERRRLEAEAARRKQREHDRHKFLDSLLEASDQRSSYSTLLEILPSTDEVDDPRYAAFIAWMKAHIQSAGDKLTASSIRRRLSANRLFDDDDVDDTSDGFLEWP